MRFTLAAALLVIASALPASAQPAAPGGLPPVAIDDCTVTTNVAYPPYSAVRGNIRWVTTSGLRIGFHVRAAQRAQTIRFQVDYRGDVETIDDTGTFAPGVEIVHSYSQFVDFAYLGTRPNFCRVLTVKFADGTMWTAQQGARQSARPNP